jgi:uncharacterized membrane protein
MNQKIRDKAEKLFRLKYEQLTQMEKHVAQHITEKTPISTNVVQNFSEQMTVGQKMADKVASFGGSWIFSSILFYLCLLPFKLQLF